MHAQTAAIEATPTPRLLSVLLLLLQRRQQSKATKRWRILRKALVPSTSSPPAAHDTHGDTDVSVRRHPGFGLLQHATHTPLRDWVAPLPPPLAAQIAAVAAAGGSAPLAELSALPVVNVLLPSIPGANWDATTTALSAAAGFAVTADPVAGGVCMRLHGRRGDEGAAPLHLAVETYAAPTGSSDAWSAVLLRPQEQRVTLAQLVAHRDPAGVDNTGNVCVWPAEEVLAHVCHTRAASLRGKTVLEIGAGMTGLAGLVVAASPACAPRHVVITDGNDQAAANIARCCAATTAAATAAPTDVGTPLPVSSGAFVWGMSPPTLQLASYTCTACGVSGADALATCRHPGVSAPLQVDVVIGADCLFFEKYHNELVESCADVLVPGGEAWLLAPQRGGSLDRFVAKATADARFTSVDVEARYDETVWRKRAQFLAADDGTFDEDLHHPLFVTLRKTGVAAGAGAGAGAAPPTSLT